MLQVRPATLADRDRVTEIALACDPEDWLPENYESLFKSDLSGLLVAEAEGRLVGCFAYEWHPDRQQAYLEGMRIDPAAQGQGFGSAFCKAQIGWLTAAGAQRLTLLSEQQNVRAHRTVQRNGFINATPWVVSPFPVAELLVQGASGQVDRSPTAELRRWWNEQSSGQYAGLPDSEWIIFRLAESDFASEHLLCQGTEGALLWGQNERGWLVRWASGSPSALRSLLVTLAQMAEQAGVEQISLSLPGQVEPLLQEAGLTLPEPWRAYLFVYTSHDSN